MASISKIMMILCGLMYVVYFENGSEYWFAVMLMCFPVAVDGRPQRVGDARAWYSSVLEL